MYSTIAEAREGLVLEWGPELADEVAEHFQAFDEWAGSHHPGSPIVLKVGGGVVSEAHLLLALTDEVAHLQELGYVPVVVHGGKPQIDIALEQLRPPEASRFSDGLRITTKRSVHHIAGALALVNSKIVSEIKRAGGIAEGKANVISADYIDQARYGEVGRVAGVDLQDIRQTIEEGITPVISCLGRLGTTGAFLNVNGDDAAAAIVAALRPLKFLSVTSTGGVVGEDGLLIPELTSREALELQEAGVLDGGMLKKVLEGFRSIEKGLIDTVAIVSPGLILKELFTEHGSGTLLKRG